MTRTAGNDDGHLCRLAADALLRAGTPRREAVAAMAALDTGERLRAFAHVAELARRKGGRHAKAVLTFTKLRAWDESDDADAKTRFATSALVEALDDATYRAGEIAPSSNDWATTTCSPS